MKKLLMLYRKINSFLKIPTKEKIMLIEAFILTGIYRALILYMPFKKLKKRMGKVKEESSYNISKEDYKIVKRIRQAVIMASNKTPWESKCLVKALTVQSMLKRRKIATTIYLGVGKDKKDKMLAHAWIRCGEVIVTGGELKNRFQEVAKFSNEY